MMKSLLIFIGILFQTISAFGQVTISFPTTRVVFQRDKNNAADVYISGIYLSKQVDRIEARLSPFVVGQGTDTGWQIIQTAPTGGTFLGKIKGTAGWYRLDVRTVIGSNIIETSGVDRIGIGEVFVIAGQSNAQGKYKYDGQKGASDDRVSCINAFNGDSSSTSTPTPFSFNTSPLTSLSFSHLDQSTNVGPMGFGPWCWGQLGDMLTARLNVPIMFFNAALQNTSALNWYESAQGLTTQIVPAGFPYVSLKNTLNFYVSILGVRAILWHQGENDTPIQTTATNYANYLQGVINISRKDANKNISWVISRASLTNYAQTSSAVIAGQNQVLATPNNNVFDGPITDVIQVPRPDGVHFQHADGMTSLANAWNSYLNVAFFQNSTPFSGNSQLQIQFACNVGNVTLSLPSTYSSYTWSNGSTNNSINVNSTDNIGYSALVKDNSNNYFISSPIVPSSIYPAVPNITAKSATQFCADKSVDLTASSTLQNLTWSSGETTTTITVKSSGSYYLRTTNNLGCTSQSNTISTNALALPATPNITIANSPANSCEGSVIVLIASSMGNNSLKSYWNLNSTTTDSTSGGSLAITKIGAYSYALRVKDSFGCYSPYSTPAKISIRANPPTPTIGVTGSLSSCEGSKIVLSAPSNYKTIWSTGDTTKNVTFGLVGDYSITMRSIDDIGCSSLLANSIKFSIHALPSKPTISASGVTSICEGSDVVVLTSSGALKSFWNTANNDSTRSISLSKSGDYNMAVRVRDNFNCYSPYSNVVKVSIRPIPSTPAISQIGTYTLQATSIENMSNDVFEWKKDNLILANKTAQEIKTSQQGYYTVTDLRVYNLDNGIKLTCRSKPSNLLSYVPDPNSGVISVYPNPTTTGVFSLETKEDLSNAAISIYTIKGQLLNTLGFPLLNERKVLNFADLENGAYIINVKSGSFNMSKKVVIIK